MGHIHADIRVKGSKRTADLKNVLIDTGATFTVLPEDVLEEIGAARIPTEVEIELGNGQKVMARAFGVAIQIEGVEGPSVTVTFDGARTVIGVETLESLGVTLDPTTGSLVFARPGGVAYFYALPAGAGGDQPRIPPPY